MKVLVVLIGIYCLSMSREVLEGSHVGMFKLLNPKHKHRTEHQSMKFIYQSIISMMGFILYDRLLTWKLDQQYCLTFCVFM